MSRVRRPLRRALTAVQARHKAGLHSKTGSGCGEQHMNSIDSWTREMKGDGGNLEMEREGREELNNSQQS